MRDIEQPPVAKNTEDHYTVERAIGSGTFGDVVQARLVRDSRRVVALKQLRHVDPDPVMLSRLREVIFFREVGGHPNVVKLYDMFYDPLAATVVFALEMMDGTLLQFMEQAFRARQGPLDFFLIGGIIKDVLRGVEHIHASGFVHRDLKPENILFSTDESGRMAVKIADFGLCRPIEQPNTATTRWTSYVATRWYRAPEQLLGLSFHTPALDIWAVSLILYELCNQGPMFPGRTSVEMTALHVQALKFPAVGTVGGPCRAIAHRLAMTDDWRDVWEGPYTQQSVSLIRWPEHNQYWAPLVSGLQWDPAARPSASAYLLQIRRLLQSECKRRGRLRKLTRGARYRAAAPRPRGMEPKAPEPDLPLQRWHNRRPPTL